VVDTVRRQSEITPVSPTVRAGAGFRPLGLDAVRVVDGFWARRQKVNREVAIPAGLQRLRESGAFRNLQRAAGAADGAYEGPLFIDSDVYKWLEAVAWEHGREPGAALAADQQEVTELVAAAQQPDGYLNTFVQVTTEDRSRFADLAFGHELYCAGHLMQAAVAQHRATGRRELLDVAVRFADFLVRTFRGEGPPQLDGHPVVEMALVELYRQTGNDKYLHLARDFVEARGHGRVEPDQGRRNAAYFSDRVPVRDAVTVEGHAVRAMYLAAGAADVATETGDDGLLAALRRQWEAMVATKMYLTGGLGSRWDGEAFGDPYELPPDRAYCETCAAIGSIQWNWRLLLATGTARYADLIERTLYNAFLPGISLDGQAYFYVNALQVRTGAGRDDPRSPATGRHGWYGVACCPPNIMRTLSSLDSLLATCTDGELQLHQYAPSTILADLASGRVELSVTTNYPWDGRIEVTVVTAPGPDWTLALRIPAWCVGAEVRVDGQLSAESCAPGTYVRLQRSWRPGSSVLIDLPMPVRRSAAHERVDAVRGCVAIERGPLVYCLEQEDQPPEALVDEVELVDGEYTVDWRPELLDGMAVVRLTGRVTRDRPALYRSSTAAADVGPHLPLTAIPYFAWANRGPGPMRVWIPLAAEDTTT
jgi:uncharacterized protein